MTVMMFGFGGGGWPVWAIALMGIGMLAFLGAVVWAGYTLMTNAARGPRQPRRSDLGSNEPDGRADAREALDERPARGEIDVAEYRSANENLT
jgi:hypothetical protein